MRPPDVRAFCLLQPGLPASGLGEGRSHANIITTLIFGLVNRVVQQWLLPAPCRELLRVQGTIEVKGIRRSTSQPLPLLHYRQRILLCTTLGNEASTTAQPHSLIITVITRLSFFSNPGGCIATSSLAAQQLHAIIRPNAGTETTVHTVLDSALV